MPVIVKEGLVRVRNDYRFPEKSSSHKPKYRFRLGRVLAGFFSGSSLGRVLSSLFLLLFGLIIVPGTAYLVVHQPDYSLNAGATETRLKLDLVGDASPLKEGQRRYLFVFLQTSGLRVCGVDLELMFDPQKLKLREVYFSNPTLFPTRLPINEELEFDQDSLLADAEQTGVLNLGLLAYSLDAGAKANCLSINEEKLPLLVLDFEALVSGDGIVKFGPHSAVAVRLVEDGEERNLKVSTGSSRNGIGFSSTPAVVFGSVQIPAGAENLSESDTPPPDKYLKACFLSGAVCRLDSDCCSGICDRYDLKKSCR